MLQRDLGIERRRVTMVDAALVCLQEKYDDLYAQYEELLAALKHTQAILHGTTCQQEMDCVEACEAARDAIKVRHRTTGLGVEPKEL
jgi:hypothetical protein